MSGIVGGKKGRKRSSKKADKGVSSKRKSSKKGSKKRKSKKGGMKKHTSHMKH